MAKTKTDSLKEKISKTVKKEVEGKRILEYSKPNSPLMIIIRTALNNHYTPQCKVRCVIEGCFSYYTLSKDIVYLKLSEDLIRYANQVYSNEQEHNFLRRFIFEDWLRNYCKEDFPYLGLRTKHREKSLISEINDLLKKILSEQYARELLGKVEELYPRNTLEASEILRNLINEYQKAKNTDIEGIMFIVFYNERKTDTEYPLFMAKSAWALGQNFIQFCKKQEVDIKVKDYISNPKTSGYEALHVILGTVEIQFLSETQHRRNEDPKNPNSHIAYKSKQYFYIAGNQLVDEVCGKPKPNPKNDFSIKFENTKIMRKRLGISEGISVFDESNFHRTPNDMIPKSLTELKEFENIEELRIAREDDLSKTFSKSSS